jgi:hypothetical protein
MNPITQTVVVEFSSTGVASTSILNKANLSIRMGSPPPSMNLRRKVVTVSATMKRMIPPLKAYKMKMSMFKRQWTNCHCRRGGQRMLV